MKYSSIVVDTVEAKRKIKTFKGCFYTVNSIFGNDWARWFVLCGGRHTGKSYSVMRWACVRKLRLKEHMKFYWLRLTDKQAEKLLGNGAEKLIDPDLKRKYGLKTFTKGSTVYTYTEAEDYNGKKVKTNVTEFAEVLSCSTFYSTKGVGYFDKDFDGEYLLVLDEMNREESEKNSFDVVYNFSNLIENLVRDTHVNIRVVMIGNTLSEASDILSAFNFIPPGFGRYKLKRKRLVVDNIMRSEENQKMKEKSLALDLTPDSSTFTNEVEIDTSLLVNKRKCITPQFVIKFTRSKDSWYTVWNGNIIKPYNGEKVHVVAMRKYLDEIFNMDEFNSIFEMFNARAFYFTNIAVFKRFQKELKLIKK